MAAITLEQLLAIMPASSKVASVFLGPLNAAMAEFQITTPNRMAAFLANVAVESTQLTVMTENLNYSAQGLANTWPDRYAVKDGFGLPVKSGGQMLPNDFARLIERQPERIANETYANRMGNGPAASGDGWGHRGAGGMELTGKANQMACADHFGIKPESIFAWLTSPVGAMRSAAWFFATRGAKSYADMNDFDGVCDCINVGYKTPKIGDAIGFSSRSAYYTTARRVLRA